MNLVRSIGGSEKRLREVLSPESTEKRSNAAPRVLVAEDDALIGLDMRYMLEGLGYEVVGIARNVTQALDVLDKRTGAIDCAVLDIELNAQDCGSIAQILEERGVPYILVTGHDEKTARAIGLKAPVIEKPFREQDLHSMLSALTATRK